MQQTWNALWNEWYDIVAEASQEDGKYVIQDHHWESPYFDESAVIEDLEKIAKKIRPLIPHAIDHSFSPDEGFAEALAMMEDEISAGMPEWIYIEGFHLEENLTLCLLEWEWLSFIRDAEIEEKAPDAFAFAKSILELENSFSQVVLDSEKLWDFFTQLPEADQETIFRGLAQHKETLPWQKELKNTTSHWHAFYMHCVDKFAPEQYLGNLRQTIPQQWQNGLPVLEDLLAKQEYQEGLQVVQETLPPMLNYEQIRDVWTPESRLLYPLIQRHDNDDTRLQNHKTLLSYYQKISKGLGQNETDRALSLQLITFEHCFNWEAMFKAFAETPVSEQVRQALFASWREYIMQRARPSAWGWGGNRPQPRDSWWLHWLIDTVVDDQKGPAWFQQQMTDWLTHLPGQKKDMGEDYEFLRLLTKDLSEIDSREKEQYPQFYALVIRPGELKSPDQTSRRTYLKQVAAADLIYQVMGYWKAYLQNFVPRPERVEKADYTAHARWMVALRELAPQSYKILLEKWRTDHQRRRNLWQAMSKAGLD
ncbi:MAG: hypothetical protein IAE79_13035 [Anaerolinea sp.]|nr:hypothetical protein [Anaerolinea sp.]